MNMITQNYKGGGLRFRALIDEGGTVNDINGEPGIVYFFRNGRTWLEAHFRCGVLSAPAGGPAITEYDQFGEVVATTDTGRRLPTF